MEGNLLVILLNLLVLVMILLIVVISLLINRRKNPPPVTPQDDIAREVADRSSSIIHRAIKQANQILVSAELKGINILSQQKVSGGDVAEQFREHLRVVEVALRQQFESSAKEAETAYLTYIQSLEATIRAQVAANQKVVAEKADAMVTQSQHMMEASITSVQERVKQEMEGELAKVRSEIADYRERRMRVIDERIIDLLEDVLRVVLEKKLSLSDQSDLVFQALEEAKREHTFTP